MASRKPINNEEQQLLKERLRSVSIDLHSDVEFLERRLRRLLWDLQEMSKAIEQVERCWGADIVQNLSVGVNRDVIQLVSIRNLLMKRSDVFAINAIYYALLDASIEIYCINSQKRSKLAMHTAKTISSWIDQASIQRKMTKFLVLINSTI